MPARTLIGLSVGSDLGGVDAAAVRTTSIGLNIAPKLAGTARVAFPQADLDKIRPTAPRPVAPDVTRSVAETAVQAVRSVAVQAGLSTREVFALGLLEPARAGDAGIAWGEVAARIAEQTGITVVHDFRDRDRAAGGTGHPITAAADYLLFRHPQEDRLLVHLGAVSTVVFVPAGTKVSAVLGFEAGPGQQLLNTLLFHGTRGREATDLAGKKAVQGCCLDPLLARWVEHPYLTRKPPKAVHADAFGRTFLHAAFDTARQLGAVLPDLLCTATHLVAVSVGEACRKWLPKSANPRRVFLTGGGIRNGFLWQLLGQQFDGSPIAKADEVGVPSSARNAAAASVLAALTCDGVAANLPVLTGAAGGRVIGHVVPGDGRNWARCCAWLANQTGDYPGVNRAA